MIQCNKNAHGMVMVHACKLKSLLMIQLQICDSKIQIKPLLIFSMLKYGWNTFMKCYMKLIPCSCLMA